MQGQHDVEHAGVAAVLVAGRADGQIAEHIEPVVEGDHHHIAFVAQVGPVIHRPGAGPVSKAAAMQPDHHRAFLPIRARGPDVEEQAILLRLQRLLRRREDGDQRLAQLGVGSGRGVELHGRGAHVEGVGRPRPGSRLLGRLEPQWTDRRSAVPQAQEDVHIAGHQALHTAGRRLHRVAANEGGNRPGPCPHHGRQPRARRQQAAPVDRLTHPILPGTAF